MSETLKGEVVVISGVASGCKLVLANSYFYWKIIYQKKLWRNLKIDINKFDIFYNLSNRLVNKQGDLK